MGSGQALQQVAFLALLVLGLYLLAIRPQRARTRALAQVRSGLEVGSRVMTSAGIMATVSAIQDQTVDLQVAPGVQIRFATGAVVRLLDDTEGTGDPASPGSAP